MRVFEDRQRKGRHVIASLVFCARRGASCASAQGAMSFLLEFVGHLIKQSMEDPVARREARNAHLRDTNERAQALCVYPCAFKTRNHPSRCASVLPHRCLWRAWRTPRRLFGCVGGQPYAPVHCRSPPSSGALVHQEIQVGADHQGAPILAVGGGGSHGACSGKWACRAAVTTFVHTRLS